MLALLLHVAHAVYLRRQLPVIYHHVHHHHDTVLVQASVQGGVPKDDSGLFQGSNEVQSTGRLAGVQGGSAFQEEASIQQGQASAIHAKQEDIVRAAPAYPAVPAVSPAPPAEGVEEYDDSDSDANELLTADNSKEALTREDELRLHLARGNSEPVATQQAVPLPTLQEPPKPPAESQMQSQQPLSMPQQPPTQMSYPQQSPTQMPYLQQSPAQMQYPLPPSLPTSPQPYPSLPLQPITLTHAQTTQMPLPVEPQTTLPGSVPGPMPAAVAMSHVQPAVATAPVKSMSVTRPKGWDQCLIFARYIKSQDVVGQEFIRTWKSTCQPAVQSGAATERYRLMCNALTGAVEPYAAQADYDIEQLCDSVLAVFHDVTAF